jgi:hypothetical protein
MMEGYRNGMTEFLRPKLDKAERERDELREALTRIEAMGGRCGGPVYNASEIARAALSVLGRGGRMPEQPYGEGQNWRDAAERSLDAMYERALAAERQLDELREAAEEALPYMENHDRTHAKRIAERMAAALDREGR